MCLALLLSAISPRLALAVVWIFTEWVSDAFTTWIVPLIGLIFLPWTTLFWVLTFQLTGSFGVAVFVAIFFGMILDASTYAGSAYNKDRMGWKYNS